MLPIAPQPNSSAGPAKIGVFRIATADFTPGDAACPGPAFRPLEGGLIPSRPSLSATGSATGCTAACVDKFVNYPGAPQKSRADVDPAVPDFKVDFGDIPAVVDGFRLLPYPYRPPADPCP